MKSTQLESLYDIFYWIDLQNFFIKKLIFQEGGLIHCAVLF